MEILHRDIKSLTFKEISDFCSQGYSEGSELDYKKELSNKFWKNLQKYIASFANMRGGLIIIGVEEDKHTGKPTSWDGIPIKATEIDKIDRIIANMSPTPNTVTHLVPDEDEEKCFILIRVYEGSNTPYYRQNDPIEWIRTGKVSTPIDWASPDYKKFLFGKKIDAKKIRESLKDEASNITKGLLEIDMFETGVNAPLTISIQPYLPDKVLMTPLELKNNIPNLRTDNASETPYPPYNAIFKTMHKGVYSLLHIGLKQRPHIIQVYSLGLLYFYTDLLRDEETDGIYASDIPHYINYNLLFCKKYYEKTGYEGEIIIEASFAPKDRMTVKRSLNNLLGQNSKTIKDCYKFNYSTNTDVLRDTTELEKLKKQISDEIFVSFEFEP